MYKILCARGLELFLDRFATYEYKNFVARRRLGGRLDLAGEIRWCGDRLGVRARRWSQLGDCSSAVECGIFGYIDSVESLALVQMHNPQNDMLLRLPRRYPGLVDSDLHFAEAVEYSRGIGLGADIRREMRGGVIDRCESEISWRGGDWVDGWTWRAKSGGRKIFQLGGYSDWVGMTLCATSVQVRWNVESSGTLTWWIHWLWISDSGASGTLTCFGYIDSVESLALVQMHNPQNDMLLRLPRRYPGLVDSDLHFAEAVEYSRGIGLGADIRREMRGGVIDRCESEISWRGGDWVDGWTWRAKSGGRKIFQLGGYSDWVGMTLCATSVQVRWNVESSGTLTWWIHWLWISDSGASGTLTWWIHWLWISDSGEAVEYSRGIGLGADIRREMRGGVIDRCESEISWRGGDWVDGWTWRAKSGGAVTDWACGLAAGVS
ncbi:hypothetical protein C8R47DRAFT_1066299 [Mycena vitilis]|nr:hypothetical protein C8R47DRAFT_1066299 [Mycena vitilis]